METWLLVVVLLYGGGDVSISTTKAASQRDCMVLKWAIDTPRDATYVDAFCMRPRVRPQVITSEK